MEQQLGQSLHQGRAMDSYTISGVFAQTMAKYGLFAALMAAGILALIAVAAYYAKNRIDIMRADSASREGERAALIKSLDEARRDNMLIVTNHLAHDSEERKANMSFLAKLEAKEEAQIQAINKLSESVQKSDDNAAHRAKGMYEQLAKLNSGVEVLKDRR